MAQEKHLFEEDRDMMEETADPPDSPEPEYGLDPLEILIMLQEMQLAIARKQRDKKREAAWQAQYGEPRPKGNPYTERMQRQERAAVHGRELLRLISKSKV